jgi:hypothetical protein
MEDVSHEDIKCLYNIMTTVSLTHEYQMQSELHIKYSRKTRGNHQGDLDIGGKILLKRIFRASGCGVDLTCSRYTWCCTDGFRMIRGIS